MDYSDKFPIMKISQNKASGREYGRLTIPKYVMKFLDWKQGDRIQIRFSNKEIVLVNLDRE